jgi:hypothetical protein
VGRVLLPSEKGDQLTEAEGEAMWAWFRAPVSKTLVSDVLTVEGTGRYTILPQTGTTDQITSIVVSQENVNGCLIQLSTQTVGHTITLVHSVNLRLPGGINAELSTIYSSLILRYFGSAVWGAEHPVTYVP